MGSLSVFVAIALTIATVLHCSQAAPVTEFFGPPQTIEGDRNVNYPNRGEEKKVEEMERFHRTYKNGTVEFKMALSNGHVQYQRISSKMLNENKIQVYEGYISEQYKDGRYGTRYYAADENGYRSSGVIVENNPPKLPSSGPYAANKPRDNENEQPSSLGEEDVKTKTKTLEDNLVEIENDLEEEQLSNLNLGSTTESEVTFKPESSTLPTIGENSSVDSDFVEENSISTTESEILKHEEKDETLEKQNVEEPSVFQNSDNPANTESLFPVKSENSFDKVSEDPESSTLPAGENSSIDSDIVKENSISTTESEILKHEENNEILENKNVEEPSDPLNSDFPYSTESSFLLKSENSFDKVSEEPEPEPSKPSTFGENSSFNIGNDIDVNKLEISTELPKSDATQSTEEELIGRSLHSSSSFDILSEGLEDIEEPHEEPIVPFVDIVPNLEVSTELPKAATDELLNDEVTSTEKPNSFDNEDQEIRTEVPEINEIKTDGDTSSVYRYPTEQTITLSGSDTASNINFDEQSTKHFEEDTFTETPVSYNNEDREISTDIPEINEVKIEFETTNFPNIEETTELSTDEGPQTTTEALLNDEVKLTEQPATFNNENQEPSTELPFTSSFAPKTEDTEVNEYTTTKSSNGEIQSEINTELPLEQDISSQSDSNDKNSRSLEVSTDLPLSEKNSTSIAEGSGSDEEEIISNTSTSSEVNDETTNKIEAITEHSESNEEDSNTTTVSDENKLEDTTTEAEILSTTENNDIKSISTERNNDNITEKDQQISTDQPSVNSEEKSSETSTEIPVESSEENDSTAKIIELTTEEPEVISTTQETEIKAHGVEVEFYHPIFYY